MRQTPGGQGATEGSTALTGPCDRRTWPAFPRPKAHDALPAQGPVALRRAHPARPCRPRSGRAARLRQHADLSRLDGALSERPTIFQHRRGRYTYGTKGTPTTEALESAWTDLAGAAGTVLAPSGLAAVTLALMSCLKAGDHLLVTDSVYRPTRQFCDGVLKRFGVETTYYDPRIGAGIEALLRPNTTAVFTEAPGLAILRDAGHPGHRRGGAPARRRRAHGQHLGDAAAVPAARARRRPRDRGRNQIPVSGGSDLLLGLVSANDRAWPALRRTYRQLSPCAPGRRTSSSALRGLRTMALRLRGAREQALDMARWLATRPEVARVLHPALESDPGHAIWKRDFKGSSGLFSIVLEPCADRAPRGDARRPRAVRDGLFLGRLREPRRSRSTAPPTAPRRAGSPAGPALRFHIGLEDLDDLKARSRCRVRAAAARGGKGGVRVGRRSSIVKRSITRRPDDLTTARLPQRPPFA